MPRAVKYATHGTTLNLLLSGYGRLHIMCMLGRGLRSQDLAGFLVLCTKLLRVEC